MKHYLLSLSCLCLVQCTTPKAPPASEAPVVVVPRHETIYIVRSHNDYENLLLPSLEWRLKHLGHPTEVVSSPPVGEDPYLTYTATWGWFDKPTLHHFTAEIHRGHQVIDAGEYDENEEAMRKGFDYDGRGTPAHKVKPVLRDLVKHLDAPQQQ